MHFLSLNPPFKKKLCSLLNKRIATVVSLRCLPLKEILSLNCLGLLITPPHTFKPTDPLLSLNWKPGIPVGFFLNVAVKMGQHLVGLCKSKTQFCLVYQGTQRHVLELRCPWNAVSSVCMNKNVWWDSVLLDWTHIQRSRVIYLAFDHSFVGDQQRAKTWGAEQASREEFY